MNNKRDIFFLITIDTEGDNLWLKSDRIMTKNASYLIRFQELCEKYQLKPTYLTNYEMVKSDTFIKFGKSIIKNNTAEVGMHLHAWNMPSFYKLTNNDFKYHPFLIEYPEKIMREKVKIMTELLEDTFGEKMLSHRAGRWAFNEKYAEILVEFGYKVDCSVTPHISWKLTMGDPKQNGGCDYSKFPDEPYFIDINNISHPGKSDLLEVPVSINRRFKKINNLVSGLPNNSIIKRAVNHFFPNIWLRPNGKNIQHLLKYLDKMVDSEKMYVEFVLHSSELMPGGSPLFRTDESIEKLYRDLDLLFKRANSSFIGCTLSEFYDIYNRKINE
jgi:hypothetical protein